MGDMPFNGANVINTPLVIVLKWVLFPESVYVDIHCLLQF